MKIILTMGLPASGKSTWATQAIIESQGKMINVNRDSLCEMIYATTLFDYKHTNTKEKFITAQQFALAESARENKKGVIVSDTNLNPDTVALWKSYAKKHGDTLIIKSFLDVPIGELIKRDLKRINSVGESVIRSLYRKYILTGITPLLPPIDKELQPAIIVDIDGTIAHMNDRSPHHHERYMEDELDETISRLVSKYEHTHDIIFLTGRMETKLGRITTEQWLFHNNIHYDKLIMRKNNDKRKDYIVKYELFRDNIYGEYDIEFVLDDRDTVVEMWRTIGLKTLQVEYGNF